MDFIQSKWPMLELSAFLKAKMSGKNPDLKIFPLFFKISPDDLKDLTSDAPDIPDPTRPDRSEEIRIKWKEIPEETRIEWKEALKEVRKFNGLQFKGEDEVSFRDEIIEEIHNLLPPPPIVNSMPVGTVGLEEGQEKKVIELLKLTSADTPPMALVIYGFGGIGKTTLAEALVAKIDLKPYHYARVDFHIDSSHNDIKSMQGQILNDLFPNYRSRIKPELTNCSEGRAVLRGAFQGGNKPIFLFIDNVRRIEDLNELLPRNMKSLSKGSRILVTTRDLGATYMLIESGLERQQYVVHPLSDQEAKTFLLKDLSNEQLKNIQEKDVKRILNSCKGIPLVLKIVRRHFQKQGYRADKCEQILENLERGKQIKEEDLGRTLTDFVYDQLEESSQEAFLDICCFFYDMDPSYVEYIVGAEVLTSLQEAAFVQRSDDKETLIVHDIIREIGRNKAESTRKINVQSLIEAANQQTLKDIRGVWLKDEPECVVEEQHLKAMTELRVLALGKNMRVSHPCDVTFKELRYLEVGGDIPCLPVNLERLPKLAFYSGPLFEEGFSMYKLPTDLRVLIAVSHSDFYESTYDGKALCLPESFGELKTLKYLDLSYCKALERLPESFGQLVAVEKLNLRCCTTLHCLPESFGELKALKNLDLNSCEALEGLPESFGELKTLRNLDLSQCYALEGMLESFGQLAALEKIKLRCCTDLPCLPESFGELKALKDLDLNSCQTLKSLPESFGKLKALKDLGLNSCETLESLPESFGELKALKSLDLSHCYALERLPESFGQLAAIEKLKLSNCLCLQCLPESFGELKALKDLDLASCKVLKRLPASFVQLAALEKLMLRGCLAMECLPESFGELKALKYLKLASCAALESLPESFGELAAVEKLKLRWCTALQCLPESFGEVKALKCLDLSHCYALELLPESFGQLAAVEKLKLSCCLALRCLPESFGELKALKDLDLSSCEALERLPESFRKLKALKCLDLSHCYALELLPESFGQLAAVEKLLSCCLALRRLPESFGELKALKELDLSSCEALGRLPESFGQLAAVEKLKLTSCTALQCLPKSFGELKTLKQLDLFYCKALERLPESFGELTSLGDKNCRLSSKSRSLPIPRKSQTCDH